MWCVQMISGNFEQFISRFLLQQGKTILDDPHKCRSSLKDFAKGEYQNEIGLFMQTVEKKYHKTIENADALDLTANHLIRQLQDENFLSEDASFSIIELLCSILRNHTIQKPMFSQ